MSCEFKNKITTCKKIYELEHWKCQLGINLFSVPIPCHKSRLSHVNVVLRYYAGQLKTAIEQEAGEKIDCGSENEIRISKCQVFVQYLTVQIVLE